jgi:RecA-family ATPase
VCCFGWGNVTKVAAQLRQQDAVVKLVICPDVGKESAAAEIAALHQCAVVTMPDGWEPNSDINDLFCRDGFDVVAALLESATEPPKPEPLLKPVSVFDVLTCPSPPPAFVWDGYLPRGQVSLLGAHGGTGKSTIALMLAVCTALGRPLFGVDTEPCNVLFVSLEDGMNIVRHRLGSICRAWLIDPVQLHGRLHVVDGTEHPELFAAETRGAGEITASYFELRRLVQSENIGLVLIDNASDAFGGDEIQRRQVRAFMRALTEIARLTDCAVMLLAHVDKSTSRNKKAEGGEGYSGSTAWHNSARSRLFLTRGDDGLLTLEHQKSNLGKMREPLTLNWLEGGFPQLVEVGGFDGTHQQGRADDDRAMTLLKLIAEFENRGQYASPATTARNHIHYVLKSEPEFQKLKLGIDATKRIVNQCQRARWIEPLDYKSANTRKYCQRWTVTKEGRAFAGLPAAPTAPTTPTCHVNGEGELGVYGGAPTAPTYTGGVGDRARTEQGAKGTGNG